MSTKGRARTKVMAHLLETRSLLRLNTALALSLVWGGLAACAFGAIVYDFAQLLSCR
jgi:hypothetical protein